MEDIINNQLSNFLCHNKILHEHQFGFLKGHSAAEQVALLQQKWTTAMEKNQTTAIAFLDLSNAFGTVPHEALRHRLLASGIRGNLYGWISNYLTNRQQQTRVGNSFSSWKPLSAGVPQGSVLAPTLFTLFINSLIKAVNSKPFENSPPVECMAYADDSLIYASHTDPVMAVAYVNKSLQDILAWSKIWGMKFNTTKTVSMLISKSKKRPAPKGITFENKLISFSQIHMHLGIVLTNNLKYENHVKHICSKINRELYAFRILCSNIPYCKDLLIQLYKTYNRPRLECGSLAFAGIGKVLSDRLESLQNRAIRYILRLPLRTHLGLTNYDEVKLELLSVRRARIIASTAYKMINDTCPRAFLLYKPLQRQLNYNLRQTYYELPKNMQPTNPPSERFRRAPLSLTSGIINILPHSSLQSCSLSAFQTHLKSLASHVLCNFPNQS